MFFFYMSIQGNLRTVFFYTINMRTVMIFFEDFLSRNDFWGSIIYVKVIIRPFLDILQSY
jgi:hypothetical protein